MGNQAYAGEQYLVVRPIRQAVSLPDLDTADTISFTSSYV